MIKPASSGDLRITTGSCSPYCLCCALSLPQHGEGIITGGTNHHVQQLNPSHLEDGARATNRRGGVGGTQNICKHVYLSVNSLPVMRMEIRRKSNLGKPISVLRWPSVSGQTRREPNKNRERRRSELRQRRRGFYHGKRIKNVNAAVTEAPFTQNVLMGARSVAPHCPCECS